MDRQVGHIEGQWSAELGEEVEIAVWYWDLVAPIEYDLRISGATAGTFDSLEDLEGYLSRYHVLKGEK